MKTKIVIPKIVATSVAFLVSLSMASAFTPSDVDGLKAWFDANLNVTTTGSAVDSWGARVGDYTATSATNQNPIYSSSGGSAGNATLEFDASRMIIGDTTTGLSKAWTNEFTFFAVLSVGDLPEGNSYILDSKQVTSGNTGMFLRVNKDSGDLTMRTTGIVEGGGQSVDAILSGFYSPDNLDRLDQYFVFMGRVTTTGTSTLRVGEVSAQVLRGFAFTDTSGQNNFTLGRGSNNTAPSVVDYTSFLLYDRALSDTEVDDVYDYLHHNYIVIPEPSHYAMGAGLLMLLIAFLRRRRS